MPRWLMKSEPDAFSIDDLKAAGTEPWDGIRNYQARNFLRSMRPGEPVLFYHSSCAEPAIVGLAHVASAARPDPTAFDPKAKYYDPKSDPDQPTWYLVDVRFACKLKSPLTREQLKPEARLADMRLMQRGNRLSILPIDAPHWRHLLKLIAAANPDFSPSKFT